MSFSFFVTSTIVNRRGCSQEQPLPSFTEKPQKEACCKERQSTQLLTTFSARQFSMLKSLFALISFSITVNFLTLSQNIEFVFALAFGFPRSAQRFALPACGRAGILFGSRKNSKRGKCSKMPQNPTRQVHALLARFLLWKEFSFFLSLARSRFCGFRFLGIYVCNICSRKNSN